MANDKKIVIQPTFVRCNDCKIFVERKPRITQGDWDEFCLIFKTGHLKSCWKDEKK